MALREVIRDTPSASDSTRSDGSASPAFQRFSWMARAELAGELQIERGVVFRVRAQVAPAVFRGRGHGAYARRASGNSKTSARCVIAGFCLVSRSNGRHNR